MEEVDLSDLSYDFDGYFDRWEAGELPVNEEQEFDARVIGIFCRRVLLGESASGDWSRWESFAALHLAKKLLQVAGGVPWRKVIDLPFPWGQRESDMSRVNARAVDVFCEVHNALTADPALNVTDLILAAADARFVSFETARADYYRVKGWIDAGKGFGPALTNLSSD